MVKIDNKTLKEILNKSARSLVGKLCKRIEVLSSSDEQTNKFLSLLKPLFKELIYEEFRHTLEVINSYGKAIEVYEIEFKKENGSQKTA